MPGKNKNQLKAAPKRRKAKRAKSKSSGASSNGAKAKIAVAAVLDSQKLQGLYATMLKTRMLNKRAGEFLSAQESVQSNTSLGQEAMLVGAITHTLPEDAIATTQNGLLAEFIRGTPLKSLFEQIIPADQQPSSSTANQNAMDSSSESTLSRGISLANEMKGTSNVVLVFSGEFPANQAAHYEDLALAAQSKLPLVCLAEITNIVEQRPIHPAPKGASHFPRIAVDGNDVVAVFRVAQEAVRRARTGHGPSLIECVLPEHVEGHVTANTMAEEARDPLAFMQQYLQRRNLWPDEWKQKIVDEFSQELDTAIANAKNLRAGESRSDPAFTPNASSSSPPRSLSQAR
ncbi:MAG TPA: thiamine pyrophosphate-dependent enzyme [Candidatus Angelobacter sp.]|nr:thiamine pyrophosphate-dependent enzyme [Candidatus Angelobacter sp.]